jgi:two-component sensor histidine kinase
MAHEPHIPTSLGEPVRAHLANIADNLQLIADMGYGDVALAVAQPDGTLVVAADARPMTAVAALAATRVGRTLSRAEEIEAYAALDSAQPVMGEQRRITRGISYATSAYPVGDPPYAVILRDLAQQVVEAPGKMESAFMDAAEELLDTLRREPLFDVVSGEPFSTLRLAGDGVMRLGAAGHISYASPNAVNIMRLAGVEGVVVGLPVSALPGGAVGIGPVIGTRGAITAEARVGERVLRYRSIALPAGALVLVEDVTEARSREQELKVKDATIREVHHRVKNNLQTIASLLRIQARRAHSDEAKRALREATERVSSMAVVHELLSGSDEERIDFTEAAGTVVDMVRQGLAGDSPRVCVDVEGSTGLVPANIATSLALVLAELVHNAIEHGFAGRDTGVVSVNMRRLPEELLLSVRDDGKGLGPGFDIASDANLGLEIVRTIVQDDLRGQLGFSDGRGTTVTVRFPLAPSEEG